MHAVIEIQELSQDWNPPFQKRRETRSIVVEEGDGFEPMQNGNNLFTVRSIQGNKVLLEYSRLYSLKGYEHPTERKLWLEINEPKAFSSLWGENGITKTITVRELRAADVPVVNGQ